MASSTTPGKHATTTIGERPRPSFAPLRLPLRRRLATVAVLTHTVSIALAVSIFFYLCSLPILWPIIVIYVIWMISDTAPDNGVHRRKQFMRKGKLWKWFCDYFPLKLHKTADLDPKQSYIFGYHPHGIISMGAFGVFATEAAGFSTLFPGIHNSLLTLSSNFRIPLYRDYIMSMGIASVSKRSCEKLLAHGPGHAITIVIGGAQESLLSKPHANDLVLNKRLGVFKIAMKNGASLVPVYAFGENDVYRQVDNEPGSWLYGFQQLFKKAAGFTVPMFHARGVLNYDFGLMPYRAPINVVVGKPIRVEKNTNPSLEEIKAVQAKYIEGLTAIWEQYKDDFATDREKEMTLIE
ncbi:diacylglycerol acyltransferase [Protomyces lactucae-debilis]|uniref:Diacylglycerol O-acyltransferase n=1 Tax=Protomyces lactucae-debilis TaxID=2754530 RepID=A0A1Y2FUE0_PROLT|nr:diacylglycerol acyltransferase [Protomyces lactucae-debilis]ORY87608.1 diacylglycerol acyltransferase [Protomyces lactucae-debilis]